MVSTLDLDLEEVGSNPLSSKFLATVIVDIYQALSCYSGRAEISGSDRTLCCNSKLVGVEVVSLCGTNLT